MNPKLVAFDTSTEPWSVAVSAGGPVVSFESGAGAGARASAALVPVLLALLDQARIGLADLDAIAFGRGPGAFTGLRTACATAQGLALGTGKPVLPIDSLLAVAQDARGDDAAWQRIWVAMDARMDEIYAAQYECVGAGWTVLVPPMLTSAQDLAALWQRQPPQAVAGTALEAFGSKLPTFDALRMPGARPRATALLPLALAQWRREGGIDAALALPLYLRDRVALTTVERDAARAAKLALERTA